MPDSYTVVPLSQLRRVIAARMSEAKQTIPHFRMLAEIEMDALLALRKELNASRTAEERVSVNDCMIKACASALMQHPGVNAQFVAGEIHQYHHAEISVITAVHGGLSTPIVRAADRKTVWEIASEVRGLAARAATGRLKMDEIAGGSFSISNLGAHGVDEFDAIINPPQCAILALGQARPQAVVGSDGRVRVAMVMKATLSVDHRAIDGIAAAAFLKTLREVVAEPQLLLSRTIPT